MTRLKFLVFALIALGLWGAQLSLSAPALSARSVEQVSLQLLGAPAAVAAQVEASRSEVQAAALKLASSPLAQVKPSPKLEAPNADRFNAVRSAALESFSEAVRANVVVAVSNEAGTLLATGTGEPAAPPEGFDARALTGGTGQLVELNGVKHFFFSAPVVSLDKGEVKAVGAMLVGAPMADLRVVATNVARDFHLAGFAFLADGKVVASAGAKGEQLEKWFKVARPGETTPVEHGTLLALGPAKLPMMTGGTAGPVLEVAARRDLPNTPYELLVVASSRPFMQALAESQKTSLLMWLGLLAATVAFALVMGGGAAKAEDDDEAPAMQKPKSVTAEFTKRGEPGGPLPIADVPPPAEASPDDFNFGGPARGSVTAENPVGQGLTTQEPAFVPGSAADDPFAMPASPTAPKASAPGRGAREASDSAFGDERTAAYPAHLAPGSHRPPDANDPFAMAGGASAPSDNRNPFGTDFNPDATKVATIPQELLNAARKQDNSGDHLIPGASTRQMPAAPLPKMQSVAPVGGGSSPEETHFLETFRDFVGTREKCGEPADGLTYEKFAAKLRKNKEQLVAKYNCKTVRFQVYVKDGKAALKATPVKD